MGKISVNFSWTNKQIPHSLVFDSQNHILDIRYSCISGELRSEQRIISNLYRNASLSADCRNHENNDFISFDHCDIPSGLVEYPVSFYFASFYSVCFLTLLKWEDSLSFLIFEIMVQSILQGRNQLSLGLVKSRW